MKQLYKFLFLFICTSALAQAPAGYYSTATGTGYALKTQLYNIIKGHTTLSYADLYVTYETSDVDNFFEKDGSVLDMYSENPAGADPYNYAITAAQRCGNISVEGDCYNREHIIPQSIFSEASPMVSDAHFITPTDGKVNGIRSNFPHANVTAVSQTTRNGSKLGTGSIAGYTGQVFEPIDEFKGDIARMYFYFATRYENTVAGYNFPMFNNSTGKVFTDGFLAQLIAWHNQDPVSEREIARNNAIYARQNNRNPYIDNPSYVAAVWTTEPADTQAPTAVTNLTVSTTTSNSITLTWSAATDNVAVTGYDVYMNGALKTTTPNLTTTINGLTPSTSYAFYVITKDDAKNESVASANVNGSTTAVPAGTTNCASEDFTNMPANNGSYLARTWTNGGITWSATDARTDQTLNGRAITIRNGALTSSTVANGITDLTVTTQLVFSGTEGTFKVKVNGVQVGTIPYSATATTTTITGINKTGNVIVSFEENSTAGNRVKFDDLSWTCENTLKTPDFKNEIFNIYPNPSKGNVKIDFDNTNEKHNVQIYSLIGQKIFEKDFDYTNTASLNNLNKGIYLIKVSTDSTTETKKLIVN
ncbi:endonuclease [Flavobacterium sp. F-328]|uniref:Endonuclease n=1 Tax=Flavobacterium erciyesense TaxID=2825842 RepID=A0ABS5D1T1_9FLAO|nr:endonuclease [Flavobacterium erciyesense]MBQ0907962.1 endonuclease [Flavobacterium erciyesense]